MVRMHMASDFLTEIGFFAPVCRGLGVEYNCGQVAVLRKNFVVSRSLV